MKPSLNSKLSKKSFIDKRPVSSAAAAVWSACIKQIEQARLQLLHVTCCDTKTDLAQVIKRWEEKQSAYDLSLTELPQHWNVGELKRRSARLGEQLSKLWDLPERYLSYR